MKYRKIIFLSWICLFATSNICIDAQQKKYPYQDPNNSIEVRVKDLMKRMSIEEKVDQLRSQMIVPRNLNTMERDYKIGNIRNPAHFMHAVQKKAVSPTACAEEMNEYTRKSIEASRWGIPVLQHGEALHGAQWGMATCFPQSMGMAATFDVDLYYRECQVIARELRAAGVRQVLSPVVNISRDPRWGRTEETYGEDVYVCSLMGSTYTKVMQENGVISTPKHYVDNYAEGGHDSYPSNNSWRVLRETVLEPFRACVEEGGARSIMAAYNTVDGIPSSSNSVLLNDILRKEWGFRGFVVSDYHGIDGLVYNHRTAVDYPDAQAQCFNAGMDVELPNGYPDLLMLVKNGKVSQKTLDQSVERVLRCKFELGLFDDPFVDASKADGIVRCEAHQALALEAARKTMTLLKNKNNTALPLSDGQIKKIGLFGPAANVLSLGDYSGPYLDGWKAEGTLTPYSAIQKRLKGKAEVILHQPGEDVGALAKSCDVVIFFGAISEGEAGDRGLLTLPSRQMKIKSDIKIVAAAEGTVINVDQEKMILDLTKTGVKTIVVLQNGSPIEMRNWVDHVDAILAAWYPGEQGPIAIAETLFGDNNPGGRTPITWPLHAGQLPVYYAVKPSGRGDEYIDGLSHNQFSFGHGLSYTTFEYENLILPAKVQKDETAIVKVTVKNTGKVKGDEVVQLYLHDELVSIARPRKELKAFKRITLEPGESKEVILNLPYRSFAFWNRDMKFMVEPGFFNVYVGGDSSRAKLEKRMEVL